MSVAVQSPRWTGHCNHCHREREIESRLTHGMRALCDECAARPYSMPSASGIEQEAKAAKAAKAKGAKRRPGPKLIASDADPYAVTFTDGKNPKLVLPEVPVHDDLVGLLAWLTSVLRLDPAHPVTGGVHEGNRGQDGHVDISRAGLPALRFEPAALISTARRFLPALGWQLHPTDEEPYGFKDDHCRRIAHVIRLLCGASKEPDDVAAGIVGTFLSGGEPVEGLTTYGTPAQRHEAAESMRSVALSPPRYLIDDNTGELVIRVSDLQEAARRHVGSSLAHGWLDARMEHMGWTRARLQGYAYAGRDGRKGPHTRCDVYRGHLPSDETDDGSVNT